MTAFKRILLATDLEPPSDRAMERAVNLALQFGADLTVLYAIREPADAGPLDHLPPHHVEAEIRRHLATIPGARDLAPMAAAVKGPVDKAMADYARQWKADLMIAGGAEKGEGLLDIIAVTTVEKISVASPLPLLAVRSKAFGPYTSALVPVDFSPLSRPALDAALALVPMGTISILHAFDAPTGGTATGGDLPAADFADEFASLLDGISPGERLIDTHARLGTPLQEIGRAAQASPTDLIVMGSSGRSGLGRALIGSVAHEILESIPCDVMIVRV